MMESTWPMVFKMVAATGAPGRSWRSSQARILDDELKWIKFAGVDWTKDGKGLFYSRYDEPQEGEQFQSLNLNQQMYYHRVGTSSRKTYWSTTSGSSRLGFPAGSD